MNDYSFSYRNQPLSTQCQLSSQLQPTLESKIKHEKFTATLKQHT